MANWQAILKVAVLSMWQTKHGHGHRHPSLAFKFSSDHSTSTLTSLDTLFLGPPFWTGSIPRKSDIGGSSAVGDISKSLTTYSWSKPPPLSASFAPSLSHAMFTALFLLAHFHAQAALESLAFTLSLSLYSFDQN